MTMVGSISAAAVDYSTPLVLELNEITILMAINTVLILVVIGLSLYVSAVAFFSKGSQEVSDNHFSRG